MPGWRLEALGLYRQANSKQDVLCECLGGAYWLFPLGPMLEMRAEVREAVSQQSTAGCLGLIAVGLITWLPGVIVFDGWSGHCPFVHTQHLSPFCLTL